MSLRDCFCLLSGRTSNFALPHAEKSMWCLWPFSWPDPLPSSVLNIQGPKGSVLCTSKIKKSYKTSTICRRWKKYFKAAHFVPWDRGPCIVGTRGTVVPRGPTFAYFSRIPERIQFRLCSGISLYAWHSTGVSCRQPAADIRVCRPSPSSLCRHDYAAVAANSSSNCWRPRLSGGSGAGVEQSASTVSPPRCLLVAAVFSTAEKGPSVSAVVQLTSVYCTIVF